MSRRVFAYELEPGDRISHQGDEVVIESADPKDADAYIDEGTYVIGYYEDSGDEFHRFYDANASVVAL